MLSTCGLICWIRFLCSLSFRCVTNQTAVRRPESQVLDTTTKHTMECSKITHTFAYVVINTEYTDDKSFFTNRYRSQRRFPQQRLRSNRKLGLSGCTRCLAVKTKTTVAAEMLRKTTITQSPGLTSRIFCSISLLMLYGEDVLFQPQCTYSSQRERLLLNPCVQVVVYIVNLPLNIQP